MSGVTDVGSARMKPVAYDCPIVRNPFRANANCRAATTLFGKFPTTSFSVGKVHSYTRAPGIVIL
jgi:hypothetical protein